MTALVSARGLRVAYDQSRYAVKGVSFDLEPGACVALVGESGSGKSTVARSLLGVAGRTASVEAEALTVAGADVRGLDDRGWRRIRGRRVGLVLQDALVSLDPLRRVGAEVAEAVREAGTVRGRRAVRERVLDLLRTAGIDDPDRRARQYAHELSGGLRQRALIATALAGDPQVLIADEPTTALDVAVQRQVLDLLAGLKRRGIAVLLVSHDLGVVADIADRILVLSDGEVVEEGTAQEVLEHPRHAYTRRLLAAAPRFDQTAEPEPEPDETAEPPAGAPILEARRLSVSFRSAGEDEPIAALDDVSVGLVQGEVLGVVGESGSGKSTLLRSILAIQRVDDGEVLFEGQPWSSLPEPERRSRRPLMQIVAQDPLSAFDPRYRVRDVLAEPLQAASVPVSQRGERIRGLLADVGLPEEVLARRPLDLSGGQRQRVAIARALAAEPRVLLCDEAVSALDVLIQDQILALLERIRVQRRVSIVFVSHDLAVVRRISDRIVVMRHGRVLEQGPARRIWARPEHAYTRELIAHARGVDGAARGVRADDAGEAR